MPVIKNPVAPVATTGGPPLLEKFLKATTSPRIPTQEELEAMDKSMEMEPWAKRATNVYVTSATSGAGTALDRVLGKETEAVIPENMLEYGAEFAGDIASFLPIGRGIKAGGAVLSRILPGLEAAVKSMPTWKKALAGSAAISGASEAGKGAARGQDPLEQGLYGAILGPLPEAAFTGVRGAWRGVKKGVASPPDGGVMDTVLKKFGIEKVKVDEKLRKQLRRFKPMPELPGALRPKDPIINIIEQRMARTTTARPDMLGAYEEINEGLEVWKNEVLRKSAKGQTPHGYTGNQEMGVVIKGSLEDTIKKSEEMGNALYDEILGTGLKKFPVKPKNIITRLENLLKEHDWDPKAQSDLPGVRSIRGMIKNLRDLEVPPVKLYNAEDQLMELEPEMMDTTFGWLWNRAKTLRKKTQAAWTDDDYMKAEARDIIIEEMTLAAGKFSDDAATRFAEANVQWKRFRDLQRDPTMQVVLSTPSDRVVTRLFSTIDNISNFKRLAPPEVFELARMRYLANVMYRGEVSDVGALARKGAGAEFTYEMDTGKFLEAVKEGGGVEGEKWQYMFEGEREKLELFVDLVDMVKGLKDTMSLYQGRGESPGGQEAGGMSLLLKNLFTPATIIPHFKVGKQMSEAITRKPPENVFTGGEKMHSPRTSDFAPATGSALARILMQDETQNTRPLNPVQ